MELRKYIGTPESNEQIEMSDKLRELLRAKFDEIHMEMSKDELIYTSNLKDLEYKKGYLDALWHVAVAFDDSFFNIAED